MDSPRAYDLRQEKKDKRLLNDCKPAAPKMIRTKPTQRILDYLV